MQRKEREREMVSKIGRERERKEIDMIRRGHKIVTENGDRKRAVNL